MRSNSKHRLLYVYKNRVPKKLRDLVLSFIPKNKFVIKMMEYDISDQEKIKNLKWAEVVLFAPGRFLSDEIMANCKHIKLMQLWSSGYEKFNIKSAKKYKIPVANNGGGNAISVSEHAVMLMLAVFKWLPKSHWRTVTGNWAGNSHGMDMFTLNGKTLGIVGFGNIGREVARKVSGFDMKVLYYDIVKAKTEIEKIYNVSYCSFNKLVSKSDIITLHLHSNKKTENIIGTKELQIMKNNAVLINVSRAQLVDQKALYTTLKNKKIAGAGLDVFINEPTIGDEPLLNLPNVVATPHMAGSTFDAYNIAINRCIQNLVRVVENKDIKWIVT